MNGNKLLTSFLVLGMGLSLVACSNDKPESKKEEAKVAEKKKEEKRMDTQDRTAKLSVPEDLSPYFISSVIFFIFRYVEFNIGFLANRSFPYN